VAAASIVLRPRRRPARYYINRLFTLWIPLVLFLVFTLGPFYYMVVVSLKDQQLEVNEPSVNPFWIFHPNLNQYIDLFARTQFPRWALNTLVVASLSTLVSLTFGTLAGYALARLRFRGASLLGIISFVTYLVPQTLLFIPLNIVITRLPVSLFLVTVAFSTVAVGLPLLNGFIGEFLVLSGAFQAKPWWGVVAATGVIWSACYLLWMYQRVFFGKVTHPENNSLPDLNMRERAALWPAAIMALVMGVAPLLWLNAIDPAVHNALVPFTQFAARMVSR